MCACHFWSQVLSMMTLCLTNRDLCRSLGSRWPNWGERRTRWPRETRSDRIAWPNRAPGIYSKARGLGVQAICRQRQARARGQGHPSPQATAQQVPALQ